MSRPLLRLSGLAVAPPGRGEPVLRDVSLELAPGECLALVGPSGAGKTTLLRTLATMIPPLAGEIALAGQPITGLSGEALRRTRARIGLITQRQDLIEPLRVDKNVMAGALGRWSTARALRFLAWARQAELAEARAALDAVGLADKLLARTRALSGGEQQRVAIARCLVQAPALLLADEPVSALDPETAEAVLALLVGLARERGMALVCSLHQPELARRHADRVLALRDGQLIPDPGA